MSLPLVPPRLPYLTRFAARDLFEVTSLRTTLAAVLTLAAAVGFAIAAHGLALGAYRVEVRRLGDDPVNRSLWYGNGSSRIMDDDRITALADAAAKPVASGHIVGVFPFSRTADDWEWTIRNGTGKDVRWPVGRTIRDNDPLLKSYPTAGKNPVSKLTDQDKGIVASPRMLKLLDYDPAHPPATLTLRRGDEDVPVALLGVTQIELPLFADFVIGEQYEAELRRLDPNPALNQLRTGPVPKAWADAARAGLPAGVSALIEADNAYNLLPPSVAEIDGTYAWQLTHKGGDQPTPDVKTWKTMLARIHAEMVKNRFPAAPEFVSGIPPEQFGAAPPEKYTNHQYAAVVVKEVVDLPAAERAVNALLERVVRKEEAVPFNQGQTDKIIELTGRTEQVLQILTLLSVGVGLLAVLNLLAVEWLRAERKLPEWGMLKAVGMTSGQLGALGLIEGAMLGGLGAALGAALGIQIGRYASQQFYSTHPLDAALGFVWSPALVMAALAASVLLCGAGTWLANRKARTGPPCESLRMR